MASLCVLSIPIRMATYSSSFSFVALLFLVLAELGSCLSNQITLGSRLSARDDQVLVSENRTFAFGFSKVGSQDQFQLAIWYAEIPGDRTIVWSANRNSLVGNDATMELDSTGNLVVVDRGTTVWTSNTSNSGAQTAAILDSGNLVLYNSSLQVIWQSFSNPSDTLLPGQPLTVSSELSSPKSSSYGGYYTLKMLQQPTSLSLGLTFNLPESTNSSLADLESHTNYSYWASPEISNVTGDVVAVLDESGSFGMVYGESSDGVVYVYKNDGDNGGLTDGNRSSNQSVTSLRRLILEMNGNLRLYRWDNDLNGSRQWVPEWAAVSNPCDIAGVCGNGVCNLDTTKTNATCTCLPGTSRVGSDELCWSNSSLAGNCYEPRQNSTSQFKIATMPQTYYYFSDPSVIANYSDIPTVSKCGDACFSDCECVASVYGLSEEKAYCWILKSLEFGGFQDPSSTLFVKIGTNVSATPGDGARRSGGSSKKGSGSNHDKVLVVPIVLCMSFLIGLLCFLLYYSLHGRRSLRKAFESSLKVSGAPLNLSYRDLQSATNNFSQLLGTGGFGSVYKGSLGDGTLIAVKKLERVLPHGEKEFITEVNTIGSMHHMNLVQLCGFCSEGSHRLLVYEFFKNGSLDKWIFPSYNSQDRLLYWPTRFNIAISTAQGIAYFHEQCRNRIIHCDIKPENILLDDNFIPKVSDFGLAKLMGREHSHVVTMIRGTRGYLAPEWVSNRPITVKADVYSYGMLLLEIVGGRRNLDISFDAEDFFYPGWAFKEMTNGTPLKVADKRLEGNVEEEEFVRSLKVAFWCIQDEVGMRPSMGEVVKMLEGSVEINDPPMPQTVLELIEEGLDQVYRAMKRELNHYSSFTMTSHPSSHATCSYSTMSPR
ncbi:G-type lectin S-receptor-like serine/threonine-protein kinase At5g24080 [Telopea speciosissima]|uniref:G-type lectin S-receptor-like serine/threonine-protein kinase At5g24080 n=1 Tax=Telopea speciosissima TaxID=54955 RepID=UPI001CC47916|nr:G-type lectin S-receptor-like serine/threonine-protein kinase At5g24080 [Telopea speciosissima]